MDRTASVRLSDKRKNVTLHIQADKLNKVLSLLEPYKSDDEKKDVIETICSVETTVKDTKEQRRLNGVMTKKTASTNILSGAMIMHALVRCLRLDMNTSVGKVLLGLTIFSMAIQVSVIIILLICAFTDYDKAQKERKRRVHILTNVTTGLITFLTITEGLISGLEVHDINRQGTTANQEAHPTSLSSNDTVLIG